MGKRLTIEDAKKIAEERGGEDLFSALKQLIFTNMSQHTNLYKYLWIFTGVSICKYDFHFPIICDLSNEDGIMMEGL